MQPTEKLAVLIEKQKQIEGKIKEQKHQEDVVAVKAMSAMISLNPNSIAAFTQEQVRRALNKKELVLLDSWLARNTPTNAQPEHQQTLGTHEAQSYERPETHATE